MSNVTLLGKTANNPLINRLLDSIDSLDPEHLEALWESVDRSDVRLEDSVIRCGVADERQIACSYADHYLIPLFDPPTDAPPPIDPSVAELLPGRICREHLIAPLREDSGFLEIAIASPDSLILADEIKLLTGFRMRPMFAPISVIVRLQDLLYADADSVPLDTTQPDERIGEYIKSVFERLLLTSATDIHFEPFQDARRVRLRIDGVLTEVEPPPPSLFDGVVDRIKVLSKLDVTQRHLPQEGTLALRSGSHRIKMRVATCPTISGEKIIVNRIKEQTRLRGLSQIGMDRAQLSDLTESIGQPNGLILLTGPQESGKRSTLYSCLAELNHDRSNLCTIEDRVGMRLKGISQVQTRGNAGLTFPAAIRAFMQQDADVIMASSVNDRETAESCVRAAVGGSLVFSTVDTDEAVTAVARFADWGIEPFLLSSTLRLLMSQRLLRRLCDQCKIPFHLDKESSRHYGVPREIPVFRADGCKRCHGTGYRGEVAVFEVIRINQDLQGMIRSSVSVDTLKKAAESSGIQSLKQSAIAKVAEGLTSLEEAISLTR